MEQQTALHNCGCSGVGHTCLQLTLPTHHVPPSWGVLYSELQSSQPILVAAQHPAQHPQVAVEAMNVKAPSFEARASNLRVLALHLSALLQQG